MVHNMMSSVQLSVCVSEFVVTSLLALVPSVTRASGLGPLYNLHCSLSSVNTGAVPHLWKIWDKFLARMISGRRQAEILKIEAAAQNRFVGPILCTISISQSYVVQHPPTLCTTVCAPWCTKGTYFCGTYIVHQYNGTELHCAPSICIVHHRPALCAMVCWHYGGLPQWRWWVLLKIYQLHWLRFKKLAGGLTSTPSRFIYFRGQYCDGKLKAPVKPCAGNIGTQIAVSL